MSDPLDPWQEAHHHTPVTMSNDTMTDAMTEIADRPDAHQTQIADLTHERDEALADLDEARTKIHYLQEGWWTLQERDRARATAVLLEAELARVNNCVLTLADTWANTSLGDDYGTHHVTQAQVDAVVAMGEELRAVLDGEG